MIDEDQSEEFWRFAEPPQAQPRSRVDHVFVLIIAAVLVATLGVVGLSQLGGSTTAATTSAAIDGSSALDDDATDTVEVASIASLPGASDTTPDATSDQGAATSSTLDSAGVDIVAPPTEVPSSVFVAATAVPAAPAPEPTTAPAPTTEPTVAPTAEAAPAESTESTADDTAGDTGTGGAARTALDLTDSDLDGDNGGTSDGTVAGDAATGDSSDTDDSSGANDSSGTDDSFGADEGQDSDAESGDGASPDTDASGDADPDASGSADTESGSTASIGEPLTSGPSPEEVALLEAAMVNWINAVRVEAGIGEATYHDGLSARSRQWSQIMGQDYGTMLHCEGDCEEAPIPASCAPWGENVAQGGDLDLIKAALLDSPEHLENIRGANYTHVGVGIAFVGDSWWVTQILAVC